MEIDIDKVRADIDDGEWKLVITIPRTQAELSCSAAKLQIGRVLEIAPHNKTIETDSLEARDKNTGEFICRISLEKYLSTNRGFDAEGTGYDERTDQKDQKSKNGKSDPYYEGLPATQYWHAVRN